MAWFRNPDGTLREFPETKTALARFLVLGTRLRVYRAGPKPIDGELRTVTRANGHGFTTAEGGRIGFDLVDKATFGPYGFGLVLKTGTLLQFRYIDVPEGDREKVAAS